jgi:hypothetical protein
LGSNFGSLMRELRFMTIGMTDETTSLRRISQGDLQRAIAKGVIGAEQASALWQFLDADAGMAPQPRFDLVHVLWYAGALIIISAMGLFTTLAFAQLGGGALVVIAVIYAVSFTLVGARLWRRDLHIPGGLLITVAVTMAPLFVFGVQDVLGWWTHAEPGNYRDFYHWIKASWLPMELATILAGLIALRFFRFPFLMAPIAFALWFMSMDLVPLIFGENWSSWEQRKIVSLWFGLAMLIVAWWVDVRARGDTAFWLHLFGLMAFWCGLSLMDSESEFSAAIYCLINIALLALAVFLQRRAYAVFGTLGVALYLGHLADEVFADSLLYPFALSLVGLVIILAGLFYYRRQSVIEQTLQDLLPSALHALRPAHAR